jgi:hypothetical protein
MNDLSKLTDQELLAKYYKLCDVFEDDCNSDKSINCISVIYEKFEKDLQAINDECSNRNVTIEQDQEGDLYLQRHA